MPQEQTYQRQVAPRGPVAQPLATGEQYGAGLARGLDDLGGSLARHYKLERQATADQERTKFAADYAAQTTDIHGQVTKLRAEWSPGHAARVKELLEARADLTEGMTEQSSLDWASAQRADDDARVLQSEGDFETIKASAQSGKDAKAALGTIEATAMLADNPDAIMKALGDGAEMWGGLVGGLELIDQPTREALSREGGAALLTAGATRMADFDADRAEAMLRAGAVRVGMSPEQIRDVQGAVAIARRKQEQEVREAAAAVVRQASEAQKAQRAINDDIVLRAGRGDATTGEIAKAIGQSQALGLDPKDLTELGYAGDDLGRAAGINAMDNTALRERVAGLRALEGAGKLSDPMLRRDLDQAEKALGERDADSAGKIGATWKSDPATALAELRALPRSERLEVAGRFDPRAGALASLSANSAEVALRGALVRTQRPGAFMPIATEGEGKGKGAARLAKQAFQNIVGQALVNDLGADYATIEGLALDIYAGRKAQRGEDEAWDAGDFANAVNEAMGATVRTTGPQRGRVQGGLGEVGGKFVVELPAKWTKLEFGVFYADVNFAQRGAVGRGGPAVSADVRRHFRPVVIDEADDGTVTYSFKGPDGRWLQHKSGAPFQLRVGARGPGAAR